MKVLFHIDEENKWDMTLANVKNLLHEEKEAEITVVANGAAVKFYPTEDARIKDLSEQVDFVACKNSLKGNEIEPEELSHSIRLVKAGVVEIVRKQADGYAYIKP